MNKLEFGEQMVRMSDSFGERVYTASRTDLIWKLVQDMEAHDFRRVVDHFIRTFRQAPLPADFDQATIQYRKKIIPEGETIPDCGRCFDVGFIRVREHDDVGMRTATLMRCSCPTGTRHRDFFIPTWERGLEAAFVWAQCPVEWFKPKLFTAPDGGINLDCLIGITKGWKARLKATDKYWRDLSREKTGS